MVPCWKLNHMLMHFFHSRAVKCGSCQLTCISTILVQVCTCSHVHACHICRLFDCITTVWGEELWGVWFCSFGNFLHWPFFFVCFFAFCDEKNPFFGSVLVCNFLSYLQDNPFSKVKPMFIQDLIWHIRFFCFSSLLQNWRQKLMQWNRTSTFFFLGARSLFARAVRFNNWLLSFVASKHLNLLVSTDNTNIKFCACYWLQCFY